MATHEIKSFETASALSKGAAREFVEQFGRKPQPSAVALPGGRMAGAFFSAVVDRAGEVGADFCSVHFFWSDERCVPPENRESNFALARDRLLVPLRIPENRIHRIKGELPPDEAARKAEQDLRAIQPAGASGSPVLDLVLLGMGEDGHVASLFPGEADSVMSSPAVFRSVLASKPPPSRITLGYGTISAARQVWVLASGPGKEGALQASLKPAGNTPLARVLRSQAQVRIFTDLLPQQGG